MEIHHNPDLCHCGLRSPDSELQKWGLCLLIGLFSTTTFNFIIDMVGFMSVMLPYVFAFCSCHPSILPLLPPFIYKVDILQCNV